MTFPMTSHMKRAKRRFLSGALLAILALFALASSYGCARVITEESLNKADRGITFKEIIKDPSAHIGKTVLLGGTVIGVENREDTTVTEVIEKPLSSGLRPGDPEASGGRFLIEFKGFLDPAVFAGRDMTIVGRVKGVERGRLGKMPYVYPVLTPIEHHLWKRGYERDSGVSFGIGIGIIHAD